MRPSALFLVALVAGCGRSPDNRATAPDAGARATAPPFTWPLEGGSDETASASPRRGMVWIPPGRLIAGTAEDRVPRIADQELAAVPVSLSGFYMDEYPYPNEPGAIPRGSVSRDEAAALCAVEQKRLCSELEWERACKGPNQTTYEYGDSYRPAECATGAGGRPTPSGLLVGCRSGFGVHDMHGGAWEWTSSPWTRGAAASAPPSAQASLGTLRGGNGEAGEVVARCANAVGYPVSAKRPDMGFRCCAGEPNREEVKLSVKMGKLLEPRPPDAVVTRAIEQAITVQDPMGLAADGQVHVDRVWQWHPTGNEELVLASACARKPTHLVCAIAVLRSAGEPFRLVTQARSGWWMPTLKSDYNGRDFWVNGGDQASSFRLRVSYLWGRVVLGELERNLRTLAR